MVVFACCTSGAVNDNKIEKKNVAKVSGIRIEIQKHGGVVFEWPLKDFTMIVFEIVPDCMGEKWFFELESTAYRELSFENHEDRYICYKNA